MNNLLLHTIHNCWQTRWPFFSLNTKFHFLFFYSLMFLLIELKSPLRFVHSRKKYTEKRFSTYWQQSEHWSLLAMLSLQPEFNFTTPGLKYFCKRQKNYKRKKNYIYTLLKVKIILAIKSRELFLCPPVCSVFSFGFLSHVSLLCSRILKHPWVHRLKNFHS